MATKFSNYSNNEIESYFGDVDPTTYYIGRTQADIENDMREMHGDVDEELAAAIMAQIEADEDGE